MSRFRHTDRLVDLYGIAELLHVDERTPAKWLQRGLLPEPYVVLRVGPVWLESVVVAWAKQTGRWEY